MPYRFLQLATFTIFFGRAYQYFFRDAPLRVLLWDETLMSPLLAKFAILWQDYATNPQTEKNIIFLIQSIGILYFMAACSVFFIQKNENLAQRIIQKIASFLLLFASINLAVLAFCYTKDKFFNVGQFFEFAIQIGTPIALLLYGKISKTHFLLFIKTLCALTFICHGLYAINYYTIPVDFISMTMNGFSMEENTAKTFLYYIGIMDIVAGILIFFPKIDKIALIYMIIWGFLTSFARIYGNLHEGMSLSILQQYWFHTLYRCCHFLLPIVCFLKYDVEKP
jgi:hypothetical protein